MFNHLVFHQKPHHSLSHSVAREIYQGWLKAQQVVNEQDPADLDEIDEKSDSNIDDGMHILSVISKLQVYINFAESELKIV